MRLGLNQANICSTFYLYYRGQESRWVLSKVISDIGGVSFAADCNYEQQKRMLQAAPMKRFFASLEFMAAMKPDSCKINASVTSDGSFSLDGFYPSEMREDFKK